MTKENDEKDEEVEIVIGDEKCDGKVEIGTDDEKCEVAGKSETYEIKVSEKIEIVTLQEITTENVKSPEKPQKGPKNSKIGFLTPKLGNSYGDKNTHLTVQKKQSESDTPLTPPAVETIEVSGLEDWNY